LRETKKKKEGKISAITREIIASVIESVALWLICYVITPRPRHPRSRAPIYNYTNSHCYWSDEKGISELTFKLKFRRMLYASMQFSTGLVGNFINKMLNFRTSGVRSIFYRYPTGIPSIDSAYIDIIHRFAAQTG
jgi:hypothetical protein